MDEQYRYSLERGSKKHNCPSCGKRTFVRYIDNKTDDYAGEEYGICDRANNCGHKAYPSYKGKSKKESIIYKVKDDAEGKNLIVIEFEYDKNIVTSLKKINGVLWNKDKKYWQIESKVITETLRRFAKTNNFTISEHKTKVINKKKRFLPKIVLERTLKNYEYNAFIQNLLSNVSFPFDGSDIEQIISLYYLGTIKDGYYSNAITFPFIDQFLNVQAIQLKQFDKENRTKKTGFIHSMVKSHLKREKKPIPRWLEEYSNNDNFVGCLFGEHLLSRYPNNPIALVEAPKTAIYGTLYFGLPDNHENFLWLAVYSLKSLKCEKCKALTNRDVILFPDASVDGEAFKLWSKRAEELNDYIPSSNFEVSNLLEKYATDEEKKNGADLADYLIFRDWKNYRNDQSVPIEQAQEIEPISSFFLTKDFNIDTSLDDTSFDELFNEIVQTPTDENDQERQELIRWFEVRTIPQIKIKLDVASEIQDLSKYTKRLISVFQTYKQGKMYDIYLKKLQFVQSKIREYEKNNQALRQMPST